MCACLRLRLCLRLCGVWFVSRCMCFSVYISRVCFVSASYVVLVFALCVVLCVRSDYCFYGSEAMSLPQFSIVFNVNQ